MRHRPQPQRGCTSIICSTPLGSFTRGTSLPWVAPTAIHMFPLRGNSPCIKPYKIRTGWEFPKCIPWNYYNFLKLMALGTMLPLHFHRHLYCLLGSSFLALGSLARGSLARGSWFMTLGSLSSWFFVLSSWLPGSWLMTLGSWLMTLGSLAPWLPGSLALGSWLMALGSWFFVPYCFYKGLRRPGGTMLPLHFHRRSYCLFVAKKCDI